MIFQNDLATIKEDEFDDVYGGHTAADIGDSYDPMYGTDIVVLNLDDIANLLIGKVLVLSNGEYATLIKFKKEDE